MQPQGLTVAAVAKVFAPSLLALALAACAVGPDYVRPDMPTPANFARDEGAAAVDAPATGDGNAAVAQEASPQANAEFWTSFNDPLLTRLVEESLTANHDLRIALASYDRSNALLRNAKLDRFPTVTASATGTDSRASSDQAPGVGRNDRDGESYNVQADASWELDLFGRVRRNVESQRAEVWAAASDLDALQVAIVGEVARTYVELRGLQERLRVARDNSENQRETLRLVQARFDAGRGTEFDTSRARAQLEATLSRVPNLEAQVAVSMHRLAVLTGKTPEALITDLTPQQPLPTLPARLDPGTPGDLLRNRPDVIAAEHRLHAATAKIGVATADLFPRFTLFGLIGSQAIDSGALFERDSETRLIGLGIDWSFLDIGRVRARIAAADADAAGDPGPLRAGRAAGAGGHRERAGALLACPCRRPAPGAGRDRQRHRGATGARALRSRRRRPVRSAGCRAHPAGRPGSIRRRPHPQRLRRGRAVQGAGRWLADPRAAARGRRQALRQQAPPIQPDGRWRHAFPSLERDVIG
ncbi:efflux transporter outer membrane subunit [Lysobacter arenosi]|nr:efflux transporter outer membrane subunit [Lysobacter arenosi]